MTQHTPGPWHVGRTEHYETEIIDSNNSIVARANAYATDINMLGCGTDNPMANARLIAAAPDLLAACKAARDYLAQWQEVDPSERELTDMLSAAIAKATAADAWHPVPGFWKRKTT